MRALAPALALALSLPAHAVERYALAVYHFNIQYVAGGLQGFPDGNGTDANLSLSERETEDAIIVESFDPLLDIYLRHPTWGADFELQGLMADVLRERHPAVLEKLRVLVARGQVAVDSFHWSDQLWIAYPRRDMEVSYERTLASLRAAGLEPGRAVWTQEGQWGPGMERFLRERALEVAILPRNLFRWQTGAPATHPLYRMGAGEDVLCVVTTGTQDDKVQVKWTFVDDGELATTARKNPYLGKLFTKDAASVEALESGLAADEAAGWHIVTVQAFARAAKAAGSVPRPLPPLTDGTWQPDDTLNMQRWMGGAGLLSIVGAEDDNGVLAGNGRARRQVLAAEAVAKAAGRPELLVHVDAAWRELLLAQVSDSTGWNPFIGERRYSETHAARAIAEAQAVLGDEELAPRLLPVRAPPQLADDAGPFAVEVSATPARSADVSWKKRAGAEIWEGTLSVGASEAVTTSLEVAFPRSHDRAVYTTALEDETVVEHELSLFAPDEIALALPTGLVGLADDLFLVLRTDSMHPAALLPKARRVVRFLDKTCPPAPFEWRFVVVKGTREQALAEALALNVAADTTLGPETGCGCASGAGAMPALISLALLLRRRARR